METEQFLRIRLVNEDSQERIYRIKKNAKLQEVFWSFFDDMKHHRWKLTGFLFDGRKISPDDTPESLEMENDDVIEVYSESGGGELSQKFFNYYPEALNDNTLHSGPYFVLERLKEMILLIQNNYWFKFSDDKNDKTLCAKLLRVFERVQTFLKNGLKEQLRKCIQNQCQSCPKKLIELTLPDIVGNILDMMIRDSIINNDPGLLRFEEPSDDLQYRSMVVDMYEYFSSLYTDLLMNEPHTEALGDGFKKRKKLLEIMSDIFIVKNQAWEDYFEIHEADDYEKKANSLAKVYEEATKKKLHSVTYFKDQIEARKRYRGQNKKNSSHTQAKDLMKTPAKKRKFGEDEDVTNDRSLSSENQKIPQMFQDYLSYLNSTWIEVVTSMPHSSPSEVQETIWKRYSGLK